MDDAASSPLSEPRATAGQHASAMGKKPMLRPDSWLRKRRLDRALVGYPIYDPPHKVEERLLSREKAAENFEYFMSVRLARLEAFQIWLRRHFGVTLLPDEAGVRKLNAWSVRYIGLLLLDVRDEDDVGAYFTYQPAWTDGNIGLNVVFDVGITLGELIIVNCPKLHWDFDAISAVQPRTAKKMKLYINRGLSFQRPKLTGFDNPAARKSPLHNVYSFARQMARLLVTVEGYRKFRSLDGPGRREISGQLISMFQAALRNYPAGDPWGLIKEMGKADYLELSDLEGEEELSDE